MFIKQLSVSFSVWIPMTFGEWFYKAFPWYQAQAPILDLLNLEFPSCSISQEHTTTDVSSLQMSYHPAFWCLLLSPVGMHAPLARGDFAVPAFQPRPSPQLISVHNTNASTSAPLPAIASSTSDSNACFWILYVTGITVTLLGPQRFPSLLACPCGFTHMSLPTALPCTTKPAHTLFARSATTSPRMPNVPFSVCLYSSPTTSEHSFCLPLN